MITCLTRHDHHLSTPARTPKKRMQLTSADISTAVVGLCSPWASSDVSAPLAETAHTRAAYGRNR